MPRLVLLNAVPVFAGAGIVPGSASAHMPMTGCALISEGALASSTAVTSTVRVRSDCAMNQK